MLLSTRDTRESTVTQPVHLSGILFPYVIKYHEKVSIPDAQRRTCRHWLLTGIFPYRNGSGCMTFSPFSRNCRQPFRSLDASNFVLLAWADSRHWLLSIMIRFALILLSTIDPGSLVRRPRKGATHIAPPRTQNIKATVSRNCGFYILSPDTCQTFEPSYALLIRKLGSLSGKYRKSSLSQRRRDLSLNVMWTSRAGGLMIFRTRHSSSCAGNDTRRDGML